MRCYKIRGNGYIRFAGSQGDARQLRQNLAEDSGKRIVLTCNLGGDEILPSY